MPIKASSARRVDALIADLQSGDAVTRDAAVARLTVIGVRAVDRLVTLATSGGAPSPARVAAFRTLEGISDPRTLAPALSALCDADEMIALAALGIVRTLLVSGEGLTALDALTRVALHRERPDTVREAAVRALGVVDTRTLGPLMEALLTDPSPRLRALAQGALPDAEVTPPSSDDWLDRPEHHDLPADPDAARHHIVRRGNEVTLPLLHRAIQRIREREQQASGDRPRAWLAARAAAHVVLAQRGSRLALYDLRETLERASAPLPSELLAAVGAIGDASCLEPLADLHARAGPPAHPDAWHRHLVEAFQAIIWREGITARHAVAKRIKQRWPASSAALWAPQA